MSGWHPDVSFQPWKDVSISRGRHSTYRNDNLRSGVAAGLSRARAVAGNVEDLSQLDLAVRIRHVVSDNGVAQLSDEIGKGFATLDHKCNVSRARTGLDAERRDILESQSVWVEGVEVDEVHAQVRDEQELARGIKNGLVRVRRILTVGARGRTSQLEGLGLEELEAVGIGDVPGGESGAATTVQEDMVRLLHSITQFYRGHGTDALTSEPRPNHGGCCRTQRRSQGHWACCSDPAAAENHWHSS